MFSYVASRACALADTFEDLLSDAVRVSEVPVSISQVRGGVGTRIGSYEVVGLLGRGGMGEVFAAFDPSECRKVALKVSRADCALDASAMLRREAELAASVGHPGVPEVFDCGEADGRAYIAMEHVRGKTLRARLSAAPIDASEAVHVAVGLCEIVAAAHAKGIVHRDIKPENVMLSDGSGPRLLDFGLAARVENLDARQVVGTPGYMAPEQAAGLVVDERADVFAMGAMLYELMTGRAAFGGDTPAARIQSTMSAVVPAASTVRPDVRRPTSALIQSCLERLPDHRPCNGADLLRRMRALAAA